MFYIPGNFIFVKTKAKACYSGFTFNRFQILNHGPFSKILEKLSSFLLDVHIKLENLR